MVICLKRGADLRMAQLMPLPLTVSCFSKIQIGFTFLVPAHPGSPGKRAFKRVCVCVPGSRALRKFHDLVVNCRSFLSLAEPRHYPPVSLAKRWQRSVADDDHSLHFIYPAVQTANATCTICNLQQSGGCSKARSALTTVQYKEKENKRVRIKYSKNNLIIPISAF